MLPILLVDDEDIVHRAIQRAHKKGLVENEPVCAKNGAEGLKVLDELNGNAASSFEGVLLDLNMPVIDGFQFLAELKKNPNYSNLPVVVLSSSDDPADIDRAKQLGAGDYQVKHSTAAIVEAVEKLSRITKAQ